MNPPRIKHNDSRGFSELRRNPDGFGDVDANVGCIRPSLLDINEFVYSIGSSSLTTPRASQGFSSSHVAEEDTSLSLSSSLTPYFLSLPTSFPLIQPSVPGLGGGASISSSASWIVKRARKRRDRRRKTEERVTNHTRAHVYVCVNQVSSQRGIRREDKRRRYDID